MKKPMRNIGHSVRVRLLTIANEREVQLEYILLRYAFERFLYRLGKSVYANRFVLKGASIFAVWLGPFCRVTRDADLEAFGDLSVENLLMAFKDICAIECTEDGVEFDLSSFATSEIKKEDKYPGIRVTFLAYIGGARVNLQCDVGSGDSVYPNAELTEYPVLLNAEAPQVRVYSYYTVVAEKFQVMAVRGLLNSRLKDYYDLWLLIDRFDFDWMILRTAIERTFARRGTTFPSVLPDSLTGAFSEDITKQLQWRAFLRKIGVAFVELPVVVERLATFLAPVLNDDGRIAVWRKSLNNWEYE